MRLRTRTPFSILPYLSFGDPLDTTARLARRSAAGRGRHGRRRDVAADHPASSVARWGTARSSMPCAATRSFARAVAS